jgi:hypothetical protein
METGETRGACKEVEEVRRGGITKVGDGPLRTGAVFLDIYIQLYYASFYVLSLPHQ